MTHDLYLNLHSIRLDLLAINERAHKCYLKCGFKDTGKSREEIFLNGKYYDKLHMDILENEFVILNKDYQYLKLEDYTGDKLYLSVDLSEVTKSIDSYIYGPDIYYISGIYAYNPRQN